MEQFYQRTNWLNHFVDEKGKVVQQGTPIDADHLNNMEEGILLVEADVTFSDEELEEILGSVLV